MRGPIEANTSFQGLTADGALFRAVMRGPIEALATVVLPKRLVSLFRAVMRGPIEAMTTSPSSDAMTPFPRSNARPH